MEYNEAGNLGLKINEVCFNNQATFGNDNDKDIAPIPHKKNKEVRFNKEHFAVRIKRIINGENIRDKIDLFVREFNKQNRHSTMHLYIDESKKDHLIVHDQK